MQSGGAAATQSLVPLEGAGMGDAHALLRRSAAMRPLLRLAFERAATAPGAVCRAITFTVSQRWGTFPASP